MSDEIELLDPEPATLAVEARAAVALKSSDTELHLIALAVKNAGIVAILDKPGREQAHGAAMELKRTRVAIEATSKAARDDATKFSKAVIAEEKRLVAIIEPEESRLLALRDDWDAAQAAIKAEAERVERARIMVINERIVGLRSYVNLALECRTSERIQGLLDKLIATWLAYDYEEDFAEFGDEAQDVYNQTHQRLTALIGQKKDEELERARVKAEQEAAAEDLRKQREELAIAQAEAKRIAGEVEAKVRAAAEEMATQRANFEAEQESARKALALQALQVAEERASLEAAKDPEVKAVAEYAAAISAPNPAIAPVDIAPAAIETVALSAGITDLLDSMPMELTGQPLSISIELPSPPVAALIQAVADTFGVSLNTAADWLTNAADEIAEYQ